MHGAINEFLADLDGKLGLREGFDVGLEMSGSARAFAQMAESMIMGGRIARLGIPSGATEFDWRKMIFKALSLKGIYGREMYETWYTMLSMLQSGLRIDPIITHQFATADYAKAFELMCSDQSGKVVLNWL